jgi:hypothetical protein
MSPTTPYSRGPLFSVILRVAVVITVTRDCHDAKYKSEHCEDVRLDNAHKQFQTHEWDDSD